MSKVIELMRQLVEEKKLQLNELLRAGNAYSPYEISQAREALLRDQIQLESREELEERTKEIIEENSSPPVMQDPAISKLEMHIKKFERLKDRHTEGCVPSCVLNKGCQLPLGHIGNCKGERDYAE